MFYALLRYVSSRKVRFLADTFSISRGATESASHVAVVIVKNHSMQTFGSSMTFAIETATAFVSNRTSYL